MVSVPIFYFPSPKLSDVKWPPAYYGLVDLVRLDLFLPAPNIDPQGTTDIKANGRTYVHNFRQIKDEWKGHIVTGANNVDPFNDVGHKGIPRDARVKAQMAEKAAEAYIEHIKKDIQGGRPSRWVFRGKYTVAW